jgi:Cu+-exporting ATPase
MQSVSIEPEISPPKILSVEGMSCASCAARIEKKLRSLPQIKDARVNFASQKAYLVFNEGMPITFPVIEKAVEQMGYRLAPLQHRSLDASNQKDTFQYAWRFILGGLISIPFLAMQISPLIGKEFLVPWVQFLLASIVYCVVGWPFHKITLRNLRHYQVTMDTLVSMGSSIAFWASIPAIFNVRFPMYFDSTILILTFITLGRYLEAVTKHRTAQSLEKLIQFQPQVAHVLKEIKQEDIPVEMVEKGDIIYVRPGELVPVDGVIIEGKSLIDESLITGESLPAEKKPGSTVYGGTLNGASTFTFRAESVGEKTILSQMIRLIEEVQGSKAPIQHMADQAAAIFVPVVLVIGVVTFLGWMIWNPQSWALALEHFISVLVIACPCALGLATPVALIVGSGVAAESGILIRRAEVLEKTMKITSMVFDKTGTLTEGHPRLIDVLILNGDSEEKILRYAGALESCSNHPLARAILKEVMILDLTLPLAQQISETPGAGIRGLVEGHWVILGTKAYVESLEGVIESNQIRSNIEAYRQGGQTISIMVIDQAIAAILVIDDPIREESKETITKLKQLGMKIHLLTGDNEITATRVAQRLGISLVQANVKPDEKLAYIQKLQSQGEKVVMIGDGYNDAPALVAADLGIAIGTGADIAKESGDVILVHGNLQKVLEALQISKRTFSVIQQNIFWAFSYNLVAIPLAAWGGVSPGLSAAMMSFSSVLVVVNALRLKWGWKH